LREGVRGQNRCGLHDNLPQLLERRPPRLVWKPSCRDLNHGNPETPDVGSDVILRRVTLRIDPFRLQYVKNTFLNMLLCLPLPTALSSIDTLKFLQGSMVITGSINNHTPFATKHKIWLTTLSEYSSHSPPCTVCSRRRWFWRRSRLGIRKCQNRTSLHFRSARSVTNGKLKMLL
jgi:hypothetical protein